MLPGHPDKLADAIADSLVQAAFERQAEALCAVEVAVHRNAVYLTGRLACDRSDAIDIEAMVRGVYRSAGYGADWLNLQQYGAHREFEARRPECAVQRSAASARWAVLDGH